MSQRVSPVIGVNLDLRSATVDNFRNETSTTKLWINGGYVKSLIDAGAIPVLLAPMPEDCLDVVFDRIEGLLFIGGADLDCRIDGFELHPSMRILDPRREEFDRLLMHVAAERHMPVMGIGCGMQLLNVSRGGNLFLHVAEDMPRAMPHFDPFDSSHRHVLGIETGSIMELIYGDGEIVVSSQHHQAVDEVAPGFAVTARCPDGVIEAIESTMNDWFAFGVQFHPEAGVGTHVDHGLFEQFVQGIVVPELRLLTTVRPNRTPHQPGIFPTPNLDRCFFRRGSGNAPATSKQRANNNALWKIRGDIGKLE